MALINTISPSNTKSHSAESLTPMERKRLSGMNNIYQDIITPDKAKARNQYIFPLDFNAYYLDHPSIRNFKSKPVQSKKYSESALKALKRQSKVIDYVSPGKMEVKDWTTQGPTNECYKRSDVFLGDYIIAPADMREDEANIIEKERVMWNLITGHEPVDHFEETETPDGGG